MTPKLRVPTDPPECPTWAGGFGIDKYGIFADLVWGDAVQRLRWIGPGSFTMGSPDTEKGRWEAEGPEHPVTIEQGFWMGDTPVTQAFYKAITGANPSRFNENKLHPVERVDWNESRALCETVTAALPDRGQWQARLPSEAEWEYACRAGTKGPLYSDKPLTSTQGRCPNLDELAWYDKNAGGTTHPVKEKAPNPWGLFDMLGNVWEWCADPWHGSYAGAPTDGSAWVDEADEKGRDRVFRGGGWYAYARWCRAAFRRGCEPGYRSGYLGFRLVLSHSLAGASLPSSRQGRQAG